MKRMKRLLTMNHSTTQIQDTYEVAGNGLEYSARAASLVLSSWVVTTGRRMRWGLRPQRLIASTLAGVMALFAASVAHAKLAGNSLNPAKLTAAKTAAAKMSSSKLAAAELAPNRFAANPRGVTDLMATQDGREVLSFIVSCALPEGTTLVAKTPDNTDFEFSGDLGLAPTWLDHPLNQEGRGWVSACLYARSTNAFVANPLSLRGPHPALAVTPEEAATFTLEEGAFYGYYFSPAAQPMMALACRGKDQAAGEVGGLITRDCAEPDPLDPTKTQCGFTYAGDCGNFAPTYACELFSLLGFYDTCHDQPISEDDESRKFRQVITVYVLP